MALIPMKALLEGSSLRSSDHKWHPSMSPTSSQNATASTSSTCRKQFKALNNPMALSAIRSRAVERPVRRHQSARRKKTIQSEAMRAGMPYVTIVG